MTLKTLEGKVSWTMVFNLLYVGAALFTTVVAPAIGYDQFTPSEEIITVASSLVALANLALRYFKTSSAIAK